MKFTYALPLLVFTLLLAQAGRAQEASVHKEYSKNTDATVVMTGYVPVLDTSAQLLQLHLVGRSPKRQQPVEPPEKITLSFTSHSLEPIYQIDADRRLVIIADGDSLDLGQLSYGVMRSAPGAPPGDYIISETSGMVMRFPVSPGAAVFAANKSGDLLVEMMSSGIGSEQLMRIAHANSLELRVGHTALVLTDEQRKVIRDFWQGLMSLGGTIEEQGDEAGESKEPDDIASDAPSEASGAPLDLTTEWLRKEITLRGSPVIGPDARVKMEAVGSSDCQLVYRISPPDYASAYVAHIFAPVTEFVINLQDLNPEATRINDSLKGHTLIDLAVRDGQRKIEKRFIEYGSGRLLTRTRETGALIDLRRTKSAFRIRDALAHAIKLCQAQQ